MKTIDTKSLLLGVMLSALFVSLCGSKSPESDNNLSFSGYQYGFGLFNKSTNTFYIYQQSTAGGMPEKPRYTYQVAADGSNLIKKE